MYSIPATQSISQINSLQESLQSRVADNASKSSATSKAGTAPVGFGDLFQQFIQQTNSEQVISDNAIENFVTGKSDNIQQVVMAMANAEMSFKFFLEVRNKVIESYSELQRLQF